MVSSSPTWQVVPIVWSRRSKWPAIQDWAWQLRQTPWRAARRAACSSASISAAATGSPVSSVGSGSPAAFVIVYVAIWVLVAIAAAVNSAAVWTIVGLVGLLAIWPGLAIQIKRWHDRGKSGWWVLIGLIPIIGFWWVLIECGFLSGDEGPNEYGPDPLTA